MDALENAKAKKPLVVSMADVAASGGYYIACNANKIVAEPSTITGSIGVFMGKPVVKGFYDWLGVTNQYVTSGKNAGIFQETEQWTTEERAKMQTIRPNKIYFGNFLRRSPRAGKTVEEVNTSARDASGPGRRRKPTGLSMNSAVLKKPSRSPNSLRICPPTKT